MKLLKYNLLQGYTENGDPILLEATVKLNEDNEEIAKAEAYEGKYTIEDDGVADAPAPTLESRVEALEQALETSILSLDAAYAEGVNSL